MRVIPVIDIRNGCVVRAAGGDRSRYQPIETPLARTSEPLDLARGLLGLTSELRWLYIADLDGIEGRGRNMDTVFALREALPDITLFVDDGSATVEALETYSADRGIWPVIGSETLANVSALERIRSQLPRDGFVLSLDWRGDTPLGPSEIFQDSWLWPDDVIVMTLARVGSGLGPDVARLRQIKTIAGSRRVYAAGGVRHAQDLYDLEGLASGALVASALHDGVISRSDLERILKTSEPSEMK
ncbi:phosphoribosylformimino-5-aminoimidazole carboxamide ribotide isomerase [Filomicrobium insigne]|uniref:Phosphoribosylformimino-5-aminoimidazole carboxamide ribotide isomerase n=1 Tax=Filomicrobium insigne TaxID=418854 RepID=A0A1H0SMT6_9HYPH|nr:HisA/HisF-related TIM barrel protein [Filomicrobium insigne]SDP43051.1 phosphoribosylformimino-5-aminoimidazole carboxamide ribotide isomerase [Filomicrobium insigne]